jgi:hypothetical protein
MPEVASGPSLLTPLAGALIGLAGVAVGVIGVLLSIWFSRNSRSRRRLLYPRRPRLSVPTYVSELRKRGLAVNCVARIDMWVTGPTDIRTTDFIDGQPLAFYVTGANVKEALDWFPEIDVRAPAALGESWSAAGRPSRPLDIGPAWLPAGRRIGVSLITDGPVTLRYLPRETSVADLLVVGVPRWRLWLKIHPVRGWIFDVRSAIELYFWQRGVEARSREPYDEPVVGVAWWWRWLWRWRRWLWLWRRRLSASKGQPDD